MEHKMLRCIFNHCFVTKCHIDKYDIKHSLKLCRTFTHSSTKVHRLKRSIDDNVNSGHLDALNLREANSHDPRIVVRAVESCYPNGLPKDENIIKEYIRALVATNNLNNRTLRSIIESDHANASETNSADKLPNIYDRNEVYLKVDDKNPLYVVVKSPHGSSFWKFLKRALSLGSIALCFGTFMMIVNQNFQRGIRHSFKIVMPGELDTTFDDVKGCDEVREELDELVEYLRNPEAFEKLGAKLPKGILLAGSPGTGKTLLARAVAGEAGVPFIHASGSEFEEMFVGVGARRVRELFKIARSMTPCIVFIDELDAVGSKRSTTDHNSVRMTLNQLLVELDGFTKNEGIVLLCATNFPESLDPALVRPGRLDRTIYVPLPDLNGRYEILKLYSKKISLSPDVDLLTMAKRTVGMTGADIFNILNTAALKCSLQGLTSVTASAIEESFDRAVVGTKGKKLTNERERKSTAYHEGGHTLVSLHTKGATKVHKATISPRGQTLGATWKIPDEKHDTRMSELKAEIDVLMGGMAAEEVIYGKDNVSTGCQNDLKKATDIARMMVMKFGVGLKNVNGPMFLDTKSYSKLSEDLRKKIDSAVQEVLNDGYSRASKIIKDNIAQLHELSKALVKYETLTHDEIMSVIEGRDENIKQSRSEQSENKIPQYQNKLNTSGKIIPEVQHSFKSNNT